VPFGQVGEHAPFNLGEFYLEALFGGTEVEHRKQVKATGFGRHRISEKTGLLMTGCCLLVLSNFQYLSAGKIRWE
jgi:hypothetical protein